METMELFTYMRTCMKIMAAKFLSSCVGVKVLVWQMYLMCVLAGSHDLARVTVYSLSIQLE